MAGVQRPRPGPVRDEDEYEDEHGDTEEGMGAQNVNVNVNVKTDVLGFARDRVVLMSILVAFNFLVFMIIISLAGSAFNDKYQTPDTLQQLLVTILTSEMVNFSLIAGVVGMASVIATSHYLYFQREEDKGISAGISLVAWSLVILSFGMACKHVDLDFVLTSKLKALATFDIIAVASQSVLVLVLFARW